jgi:tetratricopeptide (TPR) repeat protein
MKKSASLTLIVVAIVLLVVNFRAIEEAVLRNYVSLLYLHSKIDANRPVSPEGDWAANRFIEIETDNISTLQMQGILLAGVDNNRAIQAFDNVIEQRPDDHTARHYLAQIYEAKGDLERALDHLGFIGIRCDDPQSLSDQDVLRLCIKLVESYANTGQSAKGISYLEQILSVYPQLLWGKWRLYQWMGEVQPCLQDAMPARLDQYSDEYIKQVNAEALLHLVQCPNSDASEILQVARYLSWLGMDNSLERLLGQDERVRVTTQIAQDHQSGGNYPQLNQDEDKQLVSSVFNTTPGQIVLGDNLVKGGDFEGVLDATTGWRLTYQVGQPDYGDAIYDIGQESQYPLDGNQSVRITGLYPPQGGDTRAGIWADATTQLGPGCYLFHVSYKTTSDVDQNQVWIWSAGSEAPMSMKLWNSYYAIPPSDGKINQVDIIGCIANDFQVGIDVSKFVEKKTWSDVPVINSIYCGIQSISGEIDAHALDVEDGGSVLSAFRRTASSCVRNGSFRGLFKPFLSMSGEGVTWFDDLSLRRIYSRDFPWGLVEQPAFFINGQPVEP